MQRDSGMIDAARSAFGQQLWSKVQAGRWSSDGPRSRGKRRLIAFPVRVGRHLAMHVRRKRDCSILLQKFEGVDVGVRFRFPDTIAVPFYKLHFQMRRSVGIVDRGQRDGFAR